MEPTKPIDQLLSPALLAEVEAIAAVEHRPASKRTPAEAAARMLANRQFHPLPEGIKIRDLLIYGRA